MNDIKPYCVALTGGIASGKSTVAKLFETLGVTVIYADLINKKLTEVNQPAYHEIIKHFGSAIVDPSGALNRPKLRSIIFSHPEEKQWLEQLLHPLIRQEIEKQITALTAHYCIIEIPLPPNKKDYAYLDRILWVKGETGQQIQRIMARDKCSEAQAKAILKAQPSQQQYLSIADDIIENTQTINHLKAQVLKLHQQYTSKC